MKTQTKWITARAGHCPHPRMRLKALILLIAAVFGGAGTMRGAGQYVKVDYPASTVEGELRIAVTYTLWIPDGVKSFRGIIVHQHGAGMTASKEGSTAAYDLHWQALAKKWDCALLGPSYHVLNDGDLGPAGSDYWFDPRLGSDKTFVKALGEFAAKTGHPELATVPWALWGHSAGAGWADVMSTLHPERVIAVYYRSGSAFVWTNRPAMYPPVTIPAASYAIPRMCSTGVKETGLTRILQTTYRTYRTQGAPTGFAQDPRTGHECGDSRYFAIPFLDACLAMRLPDKGGKDQTLKPVDLSQAWLAPLGGDTAVPAGDYKGKPEESVWLPNEAVAKAWMEYVMTGAVGDTTPPPPPFDVRVTQNGDLGAEISWDAEADFESGIRNFIVLRDGGELAQVPEKTIGKFGRPLFQSMTYHDTPSQPMPEMRYVDVTAKAGEKHRYTVVSVNSLGLNSAPSRESSMAKQTAEAQKCDMVLWYRQPGEKWLDAMPIGNGYMGAMVFGGIQQERIALNESSFWSGRPHDYNDTNASSYFPQIRDLVCAGKFQEAEKMADDHFWGIPKAQQAYEPIGDLVLKFDGADNVQDYRRELDMETGVAKVRYKLGDAVLTREVFLSYPERVLVVRISSDKPGRVSVQAQLKSPYLDTAKVTPGRLVMDGSWKTRGSETNWLIAPVEGRGLSFETAMLARPEGGSSETTSDSLRIQGADAVTFILTTATSYINYTNINGNPAAICEQILSRSAAKDYATLRHRHESDFRGLMSRVHLNVGDVSMNEKPIDERLKAVRAGGSDPNLEALVFQFGRYLLAASSRAGGQPANLQGIWNENVSPSWGSKYTININTEMNYWPAEVCNLSECAQPLFDMLKDISVNGAETAKTYYGCGGWVTHHNLDLWRGTAPVDAARFGMWPVGGAWLCQHVWEHYAFTSDTRFLRDYYPVLKGAARFLLEVMVEEPKHHWLVTPFSMSPEHGYLDSEGKMSFLSPSPTMDVGIIRELFPHCIEASRTLGLDGDFRARLETVLTRIPPYQIGKSGFVQEWIEDWRPGPQGHNVSPNFPFYPGSSVTLRGNPDFAAAYQRWMEAHPPRGGFPLSWGIAMWARLERGDKVGSLIQTYVNRGPAINLHNAGANQSDASFGYTAAVAEALVQSHAGEISLLPALPPQWPNGAIRGLRARGGFEVSMEWKGGELQTAGIHGLKDGAVKVRYGQKTATISIKPGETVHLNANLAATN